MNSVHDMGGMHGMGPIQLEKNEPVFHAPWEGRVYAMNRAMSAWRKWNGHTSRHAKELIPAADYLRMSYYEKWFVGLIDLIVRAGLITRAEADSGKPAAGSPKARPALVADQVAMFVRPAPRNRNLTAPPRFRAGQRVRARNMNPMGHTRLPRYARGRAGTIERDYGVFPFPDALAHFQPDKPQHVYSVRFAARELWGEQARPQDSVYIDMFDDYLEPA